MTDPLVDVCFITGSSVSLDHGYALYSALSRVLPALHENKLLGVHPPTGLRAGNVLKLSRGSRLRLRLPASRIAEVLPVAGKRLDLVGHTLQVGVPEIHALRAVAVLQGDWSTSRGSKRKSAFNAPRSDNSRR